MTRSWEAASLIGQPAPSLVFRLGSALVSVWTALDVAISRGITMPTSTVTLDTKRADRVARWARRRKVPKSDVIHALIDRQAQSKREAKPVPLRRLQFEGATGRKAQQVVDPVVAIRLRDFSDRSAGSTCAPP